MHDPLTHDAAGAPGADLFQGILPMMVARAHVPLAPAKVSPAPKNAGRAMNAGCTNQASALPARTPRPMTSCTCRMTLMPGALVFTSTGRFSFFHASMPPAMV